MNKRGRQGVEGRSYTLTAQLYRNFGFGSEWNEKSLMSEEQSSDTMWPPFKIAMDA